MDADSERLITWDDSYRFGLADIDEQHHGLFDLLNGAWSALQAGADNQTVFHLIDELEKYTVIHFRDEENFMRATGYPRFAYHKDAHDQFVMRLSREKASILRGHRISEEILHFLKDWLVSHILVMDREYAAFAGLPVQQNVIGRYGFLALPKGK